MHKLSVGSKGADKIGQCFETKSRNELNFDIIKSLFGIIVAKVGENNTSLLSERKEGTLIIGKGMVGVIKTWFNDKEEEIFPEIIVSEGMLVPFAAVNCSPICVRDELGLSRNEEEGAV